MIRSGETEHILLDTVVPIFGDLSMGIDDQSLNKVVPHDAGNLIE